jgi:REP element-mobilizing transposase RayT
MDNCPAKYNLPDYGNLHDRKSVRLRGYDYSKPGAYFITICTHDRQYNLGRSENGSIKLSPIGKIVEKYWKEIPEHFKHVALDAYIIMPNHIHGIIIITHKINSGKTKNNHRRGVKFNAPTNIISKYHSQISPKSGSLSVIIRTFKSSVTIWCKKNGFKNFNWQRNFYDRIIRHEKELHQIRQYILNNPKKWILEEENPQYWKRF